MKKTAVLLFAFAALALPAAGAQTGAAVYRPGLTQARIPLGTRLGYVKPHLGIPLLASNLLENVEASCLDRTLDVFKGGSETNEEEKTVYDNNAVNPISGKTWPWLLENKHGVFAYEGEIFVEQGTNYFFYARHGDGGAIVVDGVTVSWQGLVSAYNLAPNIRRFWTAPKTGWVPFNVWLWAFDNRTGPQWSQWGAQYNVAGFSLNGLSGPDTDSGIRTYSYNVEPVKNSTWRTNVWKRFVDPGNGTFLRTVTGEKFTTVGASTEAEDGRSFDLSFANVPTNAQLVAFTGPADGFHDAGAWRDASAVLAEVPPGTSTTNVVVPLAADATVLRFRLAHFDAASTNGLEVFEEWTEMMPVTAAPVLLLDAVSPGWTNVVVAGSLESFGIGGSTATVTVEVFSGDDATFGNPVSSRILATTSVLGTFEAELFGLETNANYFVRAKAANDGQTVGFSAPVAFSTRDPAQPVASVAVTVAGFRSATLQATVSDWGGGSWGAEAWIDVSEDDGFPAGSTQTLALGVLSGDVPAVVSAKAADLRSDTDHFARVRVTNSWGVAFVSGTVGFRTADHPIDFPEEPTVVSEKGRVSATLSPTFVAPGTTYDVEIYAEGPGYSGIWMEWENQTGYGPFEWSRQTTPGVDVLIRYTVRWRYPETGAIGTNVLETTTAAKIADHVIAGLPAIDPLNGGAYLRPGDTVAIAPTPGARIDWHTNDVFSVTATTNGLFIVEALEPGAALFYETDLATDKTNNVVAAGIVLPAENPPGGIYVHRALKHWDWNDPSEWEIVVPGAGDWPNGPGSMVYIVSDSLGVEDGQRFIQVTEPVTVGWLSVGQLGWIHHNGNLKSHWPWIFSDNYLDGGSMRFDSGDGSASWIRLLGHSYIVSRVLFEIPVDMANDLEIDELDRMQDTTHWRSGRYRGLWFKEPVDVGPHEFRTIRSHPHPYWYNAPISQQAGGVEAPGWFSFRNDVRGSGTIRLEAATHTGLTGADGVHTASFTGTWIAANGDMDPRINSGYGGASLNLYGLGLGNAKELIILGSWHRAEKTWPRGALVRTGHAASRSDANETSDKATTNDWQNALPPRVVLDGGVLQTHPQAEMTGTVKTMATTTGIRRNLFRIGELVVPAGPMGRFESKVNNNANWANVLTEITNLVLDAGAVVSFDYDNSTANNANDLFLVNAPAEVFDPDAEKQFLPFFFANNQREGTGGNTTEEMAVSEQDNVRLAFRDSRTGKVSLESPATTGDGYRRWTAGETLEADAEYNSMQLASGVTNAFEAGATVRNLAGYLDMRKGAALGVPGADGGATIGFGDRPARIYVGNWGETAVIGCKLAGSAGLVKGGNGILVLAASAEGVSGGVRVAGGTLALGAVVSGAGGTNTVYQGRVAGDVVVEAGSRLVVRDKAAFAPRVRLFLNDREWIPSYAHVRMESDASVAKLFVGGKPMPNGYYGSSEAADAHPAADVVVDDVHFEGSGLLWAGVRPTMLIFK